MARVRTSRLTDPKLAQPPAQPEPLLRGRQVPPKEHARASSADGRSGRERKTTRAGASLLFEQQRGCRTWRQEEAPQPCATEGDPEEPRRRDGRATAPDVGSHRLASPTRAEVPMVERDRGGADRARETRIGGKRASATGTKRCASSPVARPQGHLRTRVARRAREVGRPSGPSDRCGARRRTQNDDRHYRFPTPRRAYRARMEGLWGRRG